MNADQAAASSPQIQSPLSADWDSLLKQTEIFAADQVNRHRWRGDIGGVLPFGYDPNSIAAQAVLDFLADLDRTPPAPPSPPSGSTDTRNTPRDPAPIQHVLQRLVWLHVDRLRHRKENFLVRNEPDLPRLFTDDNQAISPWDALPTADPGPAESLLLKEDACRLQRLNDQARALLSDQPLLKRVFECLGAGFSKPRQIAAKLGISPRAAKNALARLHRRLRRLVSSECRQGARLPTGLKRS